MDPLTRYFWADGVQLDVTSDLARMLPQIEMLDARDVEGYLAFLANAARLHRITGDVFIYSEPPSLGSFAEVSPLDALKVDGLRTMNQAISSYVRSPYLRQLLGRFATYVGASPFRAPATLNVIADVELNGGVWYPRGGIYSIARALERLARHLGVEIFTQAPVQQIQVEAGQVVGVTTADGARHPASAVVANVDVATVFEKLLPPEVTSPRQVERLLATEPSCSGFILLLGVQGVHDHLAHHNIFFSEDYEAEFEAIFGQGQPPDQPTIYLAITAKTDADHAPPEHENWFVLVNAPAADGRFDWEANRQRYRDLILDQLAQRFRLDVRKRIVTERSYTPHDLERLTGARQGALYGASSNNRWAAFRRPHNRSASIKGLYFAGGTTHPGGGVPMVTLSGRVAAKLLLKDGEG
ncbi:MAG: phytoene desaturase [Anaerolineae bacterium]|nr:phytoene desaturase [Anaerolineae bacterium]